MDWGLIFDFALWGFAAIGLIGSVGFVVIAIWASRDGGTAPDYGYVPSEEPKDEAFEYLDNEIRGEIRNRPRVRGYYKVDDEPTLKGRVDMIEKHLGIEVVVKPLRPSELAIVKKKGAR